MASSGASARRATFDAIALALAFLAVDALIVAAILTELVEPTQGIVTILALAAVVLLLCRDDVAEAIATGNEKLGLTVDDEPVRQALDALGHKNGWAVEHDFLSARGRRIGTVVHGPSGSYLVETRNRAYRVEHLGRARHHAAWLHGEVGGWVTPVLCLVQRDDHPHRRDCVWIMGVEHLADWPRRRTPPRAPQRVSRPKSRRPRSFPPCAPSRSLLASRSAARTPLGARPPRGGRRPTTRG
jgi:hypothetical protein